MKILVRAVVGVLAFFGAAVLGLVIFIYTNLVNQDFFGLHTDAASSDVILRVPFDVPTPEISETDLDFLSDGRLAMVEMVQSLDHAATDPSVKGVVARIGDTGRSLAQAQELRDAVLRFRESGKPAFAFIETMGEATGSIAEYVLASAFSEIWLQPSGVLGLSGFGTEVPFVRRSLHDIGVDYELSQRWEYKSAYDSLVRDDMSKAHRESLSQLLRSWQDQAVTDIAQSRSLDVAKVRSYARSFPFLPGEAKGARLVDHLGYVDDVLRAIYESTGAGEELLIQDYADRVRAKDVDPGAPIIAFVHEVGPIEPGESGGATLSDSIGSDTVVEALRTALETPDVKAILFRIDTPGGDYVASDTIWGQLVKAQARGLPVIVSMGDYAASGGYFVSMPAHTIVASPATLTGSVGVFSGKAVLTGLWEKLGISWERVEATPNALKDSSMRPFTKEEKSWMEKRLDFIYEDFTSKLARSRALSPEQLDVVARGRIWSGRDAQERGLVDELGGFLTAVDASRRAAGLDPDQKVRVVAFPPPKTGFEQLMDFFKARFGVMESMNVLSDVMVRLQPVMAGLVESLPSSSSGAELRAPVP